MEEYWLEEVAARQRIGASAFTPFVISRLGNEDGRMEATLTVTLRGISQGIETRSLRLRWLAESAPTQPLAVQGKVITEWAACGIACAVVSLCSDLEVLSVADEGDRFDYWVGDGVRAFGLEVAACFRKSAPTWKRGITRRRGNCATTLMAWTGLWLWPV